MNASEPEGRRAGGKRLITSVAVVGVAFGVSAASQLGARAGGAPAVGVATALVKVRPDAVVPATKLANLDAARNEFEAFQVVIGGGGTGVTGVTAEVSDLVGPGGAVIDASGVRLYRVGLYAVGTPSNSEGAPGLWPDPLIPAVDAYYGEQRNAFPFDVPAGEARAIWVDVHVPAGAAPGTYTGAVTVNGGGLGEVAVPVVLRVRSFTLPSTSTLKSAFGMGWNDACVAHRGSYAACGGDAGVEAFHVLYARAALDHRMSIDSVVYAGPSNGDFSAFDALYAPLLDGTAPTQLEGARLTTLRLMTDDPVRMLEWREHFAGRGWGDALFDYTCDEPPAGCAFADIPSLADGPHAAGIRTMVTTDIDELTANGLAPYVDIMTPVVNFLDDKGGANRRADYDAFLASSPDKELWWYQSCMSHGCGDGCTPTTSSYFTGWPSFMVDATAVQNRAMEWLSFANRMKGELYFQTTHRLATAWDQDGQCDFSGQGDGNLFYPGRPDRIGGTTDIPVESIRIKLIREGMEDYEYLHLLATVGDEELARSEATTLFPAAYMVHGVPGEALYAARARIADRIEQLTGEPTGPARLDVPHAGGEVTIDGLATEGAWAAASTITVEAGAARGAFRLLWDQDALYVACDVQDPDLWIRGAGTDGELWDADGVELLLDPAFTRSIAPDDDDRHLIVTALGDILDAHGVGATEDRSASFGVEKAVIAQGTFGDATGDTGYLVEARIPWTALGVQPQAGLVLGADLCLNDATAADLAAGDWAGLEAFAQPSRWNELELLAAGDPGASPDGGPGMPPVTMGAAGGGCAVGGAASGAWLAAAGAGLLAVFARRRRA